MSETCTVFSLVQSPSPENLNGGRTREVGAL